MGCSACGRGGNGARQAAAQHRQMSAQALAPGLSALNPIILGDVVEEQDPVKARVLKPYPGVVEGASPWVAGSLVDSLLDEGVLHDTKQVAQVGRVWLVNGTPYTDRETAERVAAALGTTAKMVA